LVKFVQNECFPLRRLPLSVLLAGIVGLLIWQAEGGLQRKHVGWLM
jgi:hypothetical protein